MYEKIVSIQMIQWDQSQKVGGSANPMVLTTLNSTQCSILVLNSPKSLVTVGSTPDPNGGAKSAPQNPIPDEDEGEKR